ncbi:hypothetical protein SFRURICE_000567 [Spodoptera frugiperda]|nr:hypothetical protein SFRURICE_000567 [Spodoptera frugiperda]
MTTLGASAAPDPGWPNATIYSLNTGLVAARQLPDPSASLANHHSAQTVETAIFRNSLLTGKELDEQLDNPCNKKMLRRMSGKTLLVPSRVVALARFSLLMPAASFVWITNFVTKLDPLRRHNRDQGISWVHKKWQKLLLGFSIETLDKDKVMSLYEMGVINSVFDLIEMRALSALRLDDSSKPANQSAERALISLHCSSKGCVTINPLCLMVENHPMTPLWARRDPSVRLLLTKITPFLLLLFEPEPGKPVSCGSDISPTGAYLWWSDRSLRCAVVGWRATFARCPQTRYNPHTWLAISEL